MAVCNIARFAVMTHNADPRRAEGPHPGTCDRSMAFSLNLVLGHVSFLNPACCADTLDRGIVVERNTSMVCSV